MNQKIIILVNSHCFQKKKSNEENTSENIRENFESNEKKTYMQLVYNGVVDHT